MQALLYSDVAGFVRRRAVVGRGRASLASHAGGWMRNFRVDGGRSSWEMKLQDSRLIGNC
jgi:hypothetical protein